jgi:endonuclease/exonuclease/phosphatase family metal-dependent hydrolase
VSDFYSESHIEAGQRLGQGILSRFPLSHHTSQLLYNPQFEVTWRTGGKAITHNRGITSCTVHIDGRPLAVKTLHLIPFDQFRVDPQSALAAPIFADLENKLSSTDVRVLLQGDFNLGKHDPPLQLLLPVYTQSVQEATMQTATIPFGEKPDRVVYRGMEISECRILDNVLTDHYPVVTTFAVG